MRMHWCTAKVNLSGQNLTIVAFDATNMISWPEAQVIMVLHGEENVYDIKPVAVGETSPGAEKERLQLKYGYKPVEHVFPGRAFRMETLMPAETENLPMADEYGQLTGQHITGNGNGHPIEEPPSPTPPPQPTPDDEDEEEDAGPANPPMGPAVFKPGKNQRPAKGA